MKENCILLVDDDENILELFRRVLQYEGYDVEIASTGKDAIDMTRNRNYDLAILDYMLKDIRGDKLAVELSKNDSNRILFVSGYAGAEDTLASLPIDNKGVLMKPVGLERLTDAVKIALTSIKNI